MSRILQIGASCALALFVITCTERSLTGPDGLGVAALNLSAFAAPGGGVPAESLEITLQRSVDQSLALDSVLPLALAAANGDSAVVKLSVVLRQSPEDFLLSVRAFGGGITWYRGSSPVRITARATATPAALVVQYVGPGANAARIAMAPTDTTAVGGVPFALRAVVYDSGETAISGVPVGYRVSDPTLAGVTYPTPYSATFTGTSGVRDSVWVIAETPTHVKDSTRVYIVPPATALQKSSGDLQSSVVGAPLPAPLVVRVLDALGRGFKGDTVRWTVTAGSATLAAAFSISDDSGYAGMLVTPVAFGTLAVQAAVPGLQGSPITFTETAISGTISTVTINPPVDTIANGATVQYTAVARDAGGAIVGTTFGWTATVQSVAVVNATTGLVTALAGDSTRIIASAGGVADTARLYVRALKTLTVSPRDTVITALGDSVLLTTTALDNFGSAVIAGLTIRYLSGTPSIAIVNAVTGWVKIIGAGTAVILARDAVASSDSLVVGQAILRVNQVTAVVVNAPRAPDSVMIGVGGQGQIIAKALDRNGFTIPGKTFGWAVSDTRFALVDGSGVVTGVMLGSTYAVASVDGFQDSTRVVVVADPPKAILWTFDSTTVTKGGAVAAGLSLTTPAGPEPKTIEIRSSDDRIAQAIPNTVTIPVGLSGASVMIYGLEEGRVVLTAKDAGGSGQSYDDALMTVDVVSQADVRLNAQYNDLSLYLGAPAVPVPVYTTDDKDVTIQIKDPIVVGDTSSAPGVAIGDAPVKAIEAGGSFTVFNVTGLKEGSAAIAYSSPGYRPDTTRVTVTMASLVLSGDLSVGLGQTTQTYVSIPFTAQTPVTVTLSVTGLGLQVPSTVTIPKNSSYVTFDVTAGLVVGIGILSASAPGFRDAVSVNVSVLGL